MRHLRHQPHVSQHLQMLGHSRTIHVEFRRDITCGTRALAQQFKDAPAYGIG
jgi:hypothetical protein